MSEHKKRKINMAHKMANMTFSIIARSCNRLMVGETYWKSVVLPSVLIGNSVVVWKRDELSKLQCIENSVWRQVLGAPSYVAVEALRGEVGCSTSEERDMVSKLTYVNYIRNGESDLMKRVLEERIEDARDPWVRTVNGYLRTLEVSLTDIARYKKDEIKRKVHEWGNRQWKQSMERKSTMEIYRRYKDKIKENWYDNSFASRLLFRARSNSLQLNWRGRFGGGDETCQLCGEGVIEDQEHFLKRCEGLKHLREVWGIADDVEMKKLLLFEEHTEREVDQLKRYLDSIWRKRERRGSVMNGS